MKKILSFIIAFVLMLSLVISIQAVPDLPAEAVADDILPGVFDPNSPEIKKYKKIVDSYFGKYGWDTSSADWHVSQPMTADDYKIDDLYTSPEKQKTEFDKEIALAKKAKLPGFKFRQAGVVFLTCSVFEEIDGETVSYDLEVTLNSKKQIISAYVSTSSRYGALVDWQAPNQKFTAIRSKVKKSLVNKIKTEKATPPSNSVAGLDFPGGVMLRNKSQSEALTKIFVDAGWSEKYVSKFYVTEYTSSRYVPRKNFSESSFDSQEAYFTSLEHELAIKAGQESKALKDAVNLVTLENAPKDANTGEISDLGDFLYNERTFTIGKNKFAIDFCAAFANYDGGNPDVYGQKDLEYAFIIVKPLKTNMFGKLFRFFYPIDTPLKTIGKDMSDYFALNEKGNAGAINGNLPVA